MNKNGRVLNFDPAGFRIKNKFPDEWILLFNILHKPVYKMKNSLKILIIYDDEYILESLCYFLNSKDYNVTTASDGCEGLKLFENDPHGFDLVITDIVMPKLNGISLISIIKEKIAWHTCYCHDRMGGVSRSVCRRISGRQGIVKTISTFPT